MVEVGTTIVLYIAGDVPADAPAEPEAPSDTGTPAGGDAAQEMCIRDRAMRLLREECRHEFWASYEHASDNSGGKPENECWERCYPYSWKSGLYLRFAEERSEVYCNHAVCCGASHVL